MGIAALGKWKTGSSLLSRLDVPYVVFISGLILGVTASAGLGHFDGLAGLNDEEDSVIANRPAEEDPGPARVSVPASGHDSKPTVYYYIVDAGTSSSDLVSSIAETPGGSVREFVFVDSNEDDSLDKLNMALMEIGSGGAIVQLIDLR